MIIVTGGAGFIGSNLVKKLNQRGFQDILIVDNVENTQKAENLSDLDFYDYMDRWDFIRAVSDSPTFLPENSVVFHHGACSSMAESSGNYVMKTNYEYSKSLYRACGNRCRFIYASSCAVYDFKDGSKTERPQNLYGYSKLLFDRFVSRNPSTCQVIGLRYFCVYGPNERHKGERASIVTKGFEQVRKAGTIRLYGGFGGFGPGGQRRDFTYVGDIADVNIWLMDHPECSGIVEVGTGQSWSFNQVAAEIVEYCGSGEVEYFDPPEDIIRCYQPSSQADISALRKIGYTGKFTSMEDGVRLTLGYLSSRSGLPRSSSQMSSSSGSLQTRTNLS